MVLVWVNLDWNGRILIEIAKYPLLKAESLKIIEIPTPYLKEIPGDVKRCFSPRITEYPPKLSEASSGNSLVELLNTLCCSDTWKQNHQIDRKFSKRCQAKKRKTLVEPVHTCASGGMQQALARSSALKVWLSKHTYKATVVYFFKQFVNTFQRFGLVRP